jgi:hypothetical protein
MATSFFRKSIAAIALSAGVVAGTAGIAAAETGSTGGTGATRPTQEQICQKASTVWERLVQIDGRMHEHYEKVRAARDKAAAEGKTDLAAKLTQRMETIKNRHDKLAARLTTLHDRAATRCSLPDAPTHAAL